MKSIIVLLCLLAAGFYAYKSFSVAIPMSDADKLNQAGIREQTLPSPFNPTNYLVKGVATVLVFCTKTSAECETYKQGYLPQLLSARPDLSIRFFYMSEGVLNSGKAMNSYGVNVKSVPAVRVYSPRGFLIEADTPEESLGQDVLDKAIEEALKKRR